MINHPQVYWSDAPDIRIDVVKGELALFLKEKNDHISLQLEPAINAQQAYVARKETPTRLAIYSSSRRDQTNRRHPRFWADRT